MDYDKSLFDATKKMCFGEWKLSKNALVALKKRANPLVRFEDTSAFQIVLESDLTVYQRNDGKWLKTQLTNRIQQIIKEDPEAIAHLQYLYGYCLFNRDWSAFQRLHKLFPTVRQTKRQATYWLNRCFVDRRLTKDADAICQYIQMAKPYIQQFVMNLFFHTYYYASHYAPFEIYAFEKIVEKFHRYIDLTQVSVPSEYGLWGTKKCTMLSVLFDNACFGTCRLLMRCGADINHDIDDWGNILHHKIYERMTIRNRRYDKMGERLLRKVRELVEIGADLNKVNSKGSTPLIKIAKICRRDKQQCDFAKDTVKFMIEKGADPNFRVGDCCEAITKMALDNRCHRGHPSIKTVGKFLYGEDFGKSFTDLCSIRLE